MKKRSNDPLPLTITALVNKHIAGKVISNKAPVVPHIEGSKEQCDLTGIINGCREHDPGSQEMLYKKFYGYVLGVALSYCPTREDSVEVVNDSFMKVFKHIKTYAISEPFKPWLRKVVVNSSIDNARANSRLRSHMDIDDVGVSSLMDIESELNAKQIYRLMNELPDLLRFVFNMYEIEGYSHKEIAEKLAIAESSSRTYLTRAKTQLRHHYNNLFMDKQ
ncbi:MAG: sigma-70 family RNA polymerase sigma factor [Balneolales bacterium]